jgi:hypothetical protein
VINESLGDVVELLKNLVGFEMYGLPVMAEVCCGNIVFLLDPIVKCEGVGL